MEDANWAGAVGTAREASGFGGEAVVRTVAAVRAAVRPERRAEFDRELGAVGGGGAFDVFLDHWWIQALVDAAPDEGAREAAVEFADLAVALRARGEGGPTRSAAEIEQMLAEMVS
ncbi:hypothetical protein [Streptomyces clavuligerus]|uniref:Uncharacterized protein n=1 Tax=Streptomyces clavuligerus TaxID=1901 RepID=B5GVR5_STRCL|nr:hypothetical protein [Streptomyces clavuligerus]EDY50411.1 hypothetical protein SSCG_03558 [Streptomyces clavuligerus]EFG03544.1 Hypothetical protein SCLAV_p0049 [Streptomyces clavuligerus]MBY6307874.1 hypothetical protein [Streptomyces clavuligerus]QCS09572.1 hypothetical protein CRV15_28380 [Streptomyces clavuligerus]QPJ98376.1 hypothetical protein GE265_35925 [Streptomyces clavuligerus]